TTGRWKGLVFGLVNGIISLLLFASTVYFNYFGSIPIYKALQNVGQVGQIQDSVESSIQLVNFLFFVDLVVFIILFVVNLRKSSDSFVRKPIVKPLYVSIATVLCLILSITYIRADKGIDNELVQAESLGILNYQVAAALKNMEASKVVDGSMEQIIQSIASLAATYQE